MPFVTTNLISLNVHSALDRRWALDSPGFMKGQKQTHLQARVGGQPCDSYLSLPLAQRMQWVNDNVIPGLNARDGQRVDRQLPVACCSHTHTTTRTEAMLKTLGAERLYPHADTLKIFRMRSVVF
jgi:hypothetical protein